MDDRTLPQIPVLSPVESVGAKVTPRCSICGIEIQDITSDHHVCVPDGKGGFDNTQTRDSAATTWKKADDEYQATHVADYDASITEGLALRAELEARQAAELQEIQAAFAAEVAARETDVKP